MITLLLRCRDLEETRQFYLSALGFNVRDTAEGTLTADQHGAALIFTSGDLWGSPPTFSGTIYFTVPDADGYFASIKDKVTVAWPIQVQSAAFGMSIPRIYGTARVAGNIIWSTDIVETPSTTTDLERGYVTTPMALPLLARPGAVWYGVKDGEHLFPHELPQHGRQLVMAPTSTRGAPP